MRWCEEEEEGEEEEEDVLWEERRNLLDASGTGSLLDAVSERRHVACSGQLGMLYGCQERELGSWAEDEESA